MGSGVSKDPGGKKYTEKMATGTFFYCVNIGQEIIAQIKLFNLRFAFSFYIMFSIKKKLESCFSNLQNSCLLFSTIKEG